jgi:hypothetical protein
MSALKLVFSAAFAASLNLTVAAPAFVEKSLEALTVRLPIVAGYPAA